MVMKTLAVAVLSVGILTTALVGVTWAQQAPNTANLTAFSGEMNFLSQTGYAQYLKHLQAGQWTPFTP